MSKVYSQFLYEATNAEFKRLFGKIDSAPLFIEVKKADSKLAAYTNFCTDLLDFITGSGLFAGILFIPATQLLKFAFCPHFQKAEVKEIAGMYEAGELFYENVSVVVCPQLDKNVMFLYDYGADRMTKFIIEEDK